MARMDVVGTDAAIAPQEQGRAAQTGRLARGQEERRRRVITAAIELASERGTPDAIQMRDIAERSNVALGTIYKYYTSKDQVLGAAHLAWASQLEVAPEPVLPDDTPLVERAVDMLRRITASVERDPNLYRALFIASAPASWSGRMDDVHYQLSRLLYRMFRNALGMVDDDSRRGMQRILQQIWYAALMRWVNGWGELSDVGDELEFACRWLLTGPPTPLSIAPTDRTRNKPSSAGAGQD